MAFSAGAVAAAPFKLLAGIGARFRVSSGFKVDAGKSRSGKAISLLEGDVFTTKVSTLDTDGDIYVYESTRSKEGGPNHHYHFS